MDCLHQRNIIFRSPLFEIIDSRWYSSSEHSRAAIEIQGYGISFIRRGHFLFERGRQKFDFHTQVVQHHNPGEVYLASHPIIRFHRSTTIKLNPLLLAEVRSQLWRPKVYPDHLTRKDEVLFPAPMSAAVPQLDYLHKQVYTLAQAVDRETRQLRLEILVLDLVSTLFAHLYLADQSPIMPLNYRQIQHHLWKIEQAKEFIHQRFDEKLSLSEIAATVQLSEYHFLRLFRRFTGLTPYQYLLEVRLHHALILLRHTQKTVTEICYEAGFESLSHFIDTFGKRFGTSPSRARHQSHHSLPESFNGRQYPKHRRSIEYAF